ncbi:AraC family transcriptional regulator [Photobacterium rosenbergii]|uniref:AraC family transcriptional regulator n=1 Tax=Photobacterium rosenbergii TaxID=294936 RepID=A0A2T3N843_9GAMM|nr:AraC family transcriptional regulator [Photobacterium rosenbergii]PSW09184.1 AraC family transcriptional regulator [Photobacterium rosenbergii]
MKSTSSTTDILLTSTMNIWPFIEYCERKGFDWKAVAKECELPVEMMDKKHWLPTKDIMLFLFGLERRYGYLVGIEIGRFISVKQLSPELDSKIEQCGSLSEGLQLLVLEMPKLNNHVIVWTEMIDGKWWLCHRSAFRDSTPGFEQAEWFRTLAMINYCRRFIEGYWQPEQAKLMSPDTNLDKLPQTFTKTKLVFGQTFGAFTVPLPDGFHPITEQTRDANWHHSVSKLIDTYAPLPWFNIKWFSTLLGMTPRTLQRNLGQQGLTFRELRDNSRRDHAIQLLGQEGVSTHEVAWRVGYDDLSNFNRAFRKWTGYTAPAYRRKILS